jgi:ABC-type polysaccharide/polyol phosphate export permease
VAILIIFGINPFPQILLIFPSLLLVSINLLWFSTLIAIVSTRFRDLSPVIQSLVLIAFLLTPVMWMERQLPVDSQILVYNPFVYLLDSMRSPMLGKSPPIQTWYVLVAFALVGCVPTFYFYKVNIRNIVYWI